jgi:D-alanyl-D-alanine carboxypeptidase
MKAGECVALTQGAGGNVSVWMSLSRSHGSACWFRACFWAATLTLGAALTLSAQAATQLAPGPSGPVYEAIVLDAETGQVLRALNPDAITYPASLTKMMTLYLTFEALNQGRLRLDQYVTVSAAAAAHAPSKLGFQPGEVVMVRDLILGIVTKSANDAAAVLAEALGGGSEPAFAATMTQKARQLGMSHTTYANASGLPDPAQLTTARDIARLALALYHDFPREYRYFSVKEFDFQGEHVTGHDHMLDWYPGADGIKTGFTVASGFNLATSAVQNGRRLIGVILGGHSVRGRDLAMAQLLDLGFADLARQAPTAVVQRQQPAAPVAAIPVIAAVTTSATPPAAVQPAAVQPASVQPASVQPASVQAASPSRSIADLAAAAMAGPTPVPAVQQAAAPPPAPISDQPPEHEPPSSIAAVASAAIKHLSPVAKAEAAEPPVAGWGIQIGAYKAEAAAERAERQAAHLTLARGKQAEILAPSAGERLYRVRLMRFTPQAARAACEELHRQHQGCTVVPPSSVKVASAGR